MSTGAMCAPVFQDREIAMNRKQRDEEKARYWQQTIREAARSGISIREFCRQRGLRTSQFCWWQRRLKERRQPRTMRRSGTGPTSFALVSEKQEPWMRASSSCLETDVGCASERVLMRRRCGRFCPQWSPSDAEFSGGDQGLSVHGSVRHAPVV